MTKKDRQTVNFIKFTYQNSTILWDNSTTYLYLSNHLSVLDFKK